MLTKNELNQEAEFLSTVHSLLETYEEIAATKMERIRGSVLENRNFLLEVNAIYQQVKSSYRAQIELFMKRKRIKDPSKLTFIKKNGKTLYVFISSNTGLYGGLVQKAYRVFIESFRKKPGDVAILGKLGFEMFVGEKIKAPVAFFEFPDDHIDETSMQKICKYLVEYQDVLVFYEKFNSVIDQTPIVTNISGGMLPEEKSEPSIKYLFEPSLEKIMEFFEKEIVFSVFKQTIFESELAKFAARMISMDTGSENTRVKLKQILAVKNKLKHSESNKKQLEKFSAMKLWR